MSKADKAKSILDYLLYETGITEGKDVEQRLEYSRMVHEFVDLVVDAALEKLIFQLGGRDNLRLLGDFAAEAIERAKEPVVMKQKLLGISWEKVRERMEDLLYENPNMHKSDAFRMAFLAEAEATLEDFSKADDRSDGAGEDRDVICRFPFERDAVDAISYGLGGYHYGHGKGRWQEQFERFQKMVEEGEIKLPEEDGFDIFSHTFNFEWEPPKGAKERLEELPEADSVAVTPAQWEVFKAVLAERGYQDEKWGTVRENPHSQLEWVVIMQQYLEKAKLAWMGDMADVQVRREVLKVVALGVAMLEQHGRAEKVR